MPLADATTGMFCHSIQIEVHLLSTASAGRPPTWTDNTCKRPVQLSEYICLSRICASCWKAGPWLLTVKRLDPSRFSLAWTRSGGNERNACTGCLKPKKSVSSCRGAWRETRSPKRHTPSRHPSIRSSGLNMESFRQVAD